MGNVGDETFEALGTALSDEYVTKSDETKFANLKLVSVGGGGNTEPGPVIISQVYETLTGTFVAEVDDVTDYEMNGLKRVTRVLIAQAGTSVASYVVGTQTYGTGYLAKVSIEGNDAWVRVRAEYLDAGIVSRTVRLLDGGLREETISAFYTRVAPASGIVVYDREENEDGYPVWTVTAMQSRTGGDPTSGTAESYTQLESFTYPGRAKLFTQTKTFGAVDFNFTDLYLSNPISQLLDCTVTVSYSATNSIGTLANTLWNPEGWATLNAVYLVENSVGGGRSKVQALDGYVVAAPDSGNTQTITDASAAGEVAIFFGSFLNTGFGGTAVISGGPASPGGSTWTLKYSVTPAFVGTDGTQYYRRTIVTCAVPAQPALPV